MFNKINYQLLILQRFALVTHYIVKYFKVKIVKKLHPH